MDKLLDIMSRSGNCRIKNSKAIGPAMEAESLARSWMSLPRALHQEGALQEEEDNYPPLVLPSLDYEHKLEMRVVTAEEKQRRSLLRQHGALLRQQVPAEVADCSASHLPAWEEASMPHPPPKEALGAKAQKTRQAQSEKALEAKAQTPWQAQSEEVLFANFQALRLAQSEEALETKAKMSEEALETKAKRSEEVLKTKAQTSEEQPSDAESIVSVRVTHDDPENAQRNVAMATSSTSLPHVFELDQVPDDLIRTSEEQWAGTDLEGHGASRYYPSGERKRPYRVTKRGGKKKTKDEVQLGPRGSEERDPLEAKAQMSEELLEATAQTSEEVLEPKAQTSDEGLGAQDQLSEEALQAGAHTSITPGGCAYHYRPEGVPSRMRLNASEDEQWIEETVRHGERVHIVGIFGHPGVWAFVRTFRSPGQGWIRLEHVHGIALPIRPPPRRRA